MKPSDMNLGAIELVLQHQLRLCNRKEIPKHELQHYQVRARVNEMTEGMVIEVHRQLYGREVHSHRRTELGEHVPEDWWQAFKERWFPKWALRRWPARQRFIEKKVTHKVIRVCPHLTLPPNRREHAIFLYPEQEL